LPVFVPALGPDQHRASARPQAARRIERACRQAIFTEHDFTNNLLRERNTQPGLDAIRRLRWPPEKIVELDIATLLRYRNSIK
jgi:hypothetical protein